MAGVTLFAAPPRTRLPGLTARDSCRNSRLPRPGSTPMANPPRPRRFPGDDFAPGPRGRDVPPPTGPPERGRSLLVYAERPTQKGQDIASHAKRRFYAGFVRQGNGSMGHCPFCRPHDGRILPQHGHLTFSAENLFEKGHSGVSQGNGSTGYGLIRRQHDGYIRARSPVHKVRTKLAYSAPGSPGRVIQHPGVDLNPIMHWRVSSPAQ